jgi:hypothetical protein
MLWTAALCYPWACQIRHWVTCTSETVDLSAALPSDTMIFCKTRCTPSYGVLDTAVAHELLFCICAKPQVTFFLLSEAQFCDSFLWEAEGKLCAEKNPEHLSSKQWLCGSWFLIQGESLQIDLLFCLSF